MDAGQALYVVLVQLLLFSAAAALTASAFLAIRRPRRWWAYVLTKVGITITNGVLLSVVFPAQTIPVTPISVSYAVGLAATGIGLSFVAGDLAKRQGVLVPETEPETP